MLCITACGPTVLRRGWPHDRKWAIELHDGSTTNAVPMHRLSHAERELLNSAEYQDFINTAEPGSRHLIEGKTNKFELILGGFDWDRMCVTVTREVRPLSYELTIPPPRVQVVDAEDACIMGLLTNITIRMSGFESASCSQIATFVQQQLPATNGVPLFYIRMDERGGPVFPDTTRFNLAEDTHTLYDVLNLLTSIFTVRCSVSSNTITLVTEDVEQPLSPSSKDKKIP